MALEQSVQHPHFCEPLGVESFIQALDIPTSTTLAIPSPSSSHVPVGHTQLFLTVCAGILQTHKKPLAPAHGNTFVASSCSWS